MLSYSYLPSKGLAVFHKWEGSQAQKAGEVQLSKQCLPPHLSVLDLPDSSGRENNSLSTQAQHCHMSTATCLAGAITIAKKKHIFTQLKTLNSENTERSKGNCSLVVVGVEQNSVLSQVNKMICSLLVCAQLKLILSREGDEDRRRCSELRSHF